MRWCGKDETTSANGNLILHSGKKERSEHGVGFIISKDMKQSLKEWKPISERIITARFFTKIRKCLHIIQCYAPTEDAEPTLKNDFYDQLTATIRNVPNRDILILMGDFNAKIGSDNTGLSHIMGKHGMGIKNDNGERLIEFCQTFDMVIGGSLFPHKEIHKYTWTSPNGSTKNQIDHICIRRKWRGSLNDVRSKSGADIDSDHELVVATVRLKLKKNYRKVTEKKNKRLDVEQLRDIPKRNRVANLLRESITPNPRSWEDAHKTLKDITDEEIGIKQKEKRKIWITNETWQLIKERNSLKEKKLHNPSLSTQYKNVAKAVKTSARRDKRKYFKNLAEDAEAAAGSNNMRSLHQLIGRLANTYTSRTAIVKDDGGNLITCVEGQTKRWREHFIRVSNVDTPESQENIEQSQIETAPNSGISTETPSIEEVIHSIVKLKRNKAPGEDGIPPELLQTNPAAAAAILHPHLQAAWTNESLPISWTEGAIIKLPKKMI
ncbi:uncharacterized protein [Musca autumnalis]|uniref:uncharacterized protein n=1 Tax=Musca autumnalis TaxID=221902 RepID=UPI003CEF59F8